MIISAAIKSKEGTTYLAEFLPTEIRLAAAKHADDFLYTLQIEDDDIDLPYLETSRVRYIYQQTGDLYWVLVTKPLSNLDSDVNLLGQLVCTIMEYGSSETNSQTLTDQQRDLFYRHIWRPWDDDPQCTTCGRHNNSTEIWDFEFGTRLNFLRQIRDGAVGEGDVNYFNGLINEAWAVSSQLFQNSSQHELSDSDSFCSSESGSVSEEALIEGIRLSCRLGDLRVATKRIQDPYARLFVRRDLLNQTETNQQTQMSSAPSFEEIDSMCQS